MTTSPLRGAARRAARLLPLLGLAAASCVLAQAPPAASPPASPPASSAATAAPAPAASREARATRLLGHAVHDRAGRRIGAVLDLIVDLEHERVPYAVLSLDAGLGQPDRLFSFPLDRFAIADARLVLAFDPARLAAAPSFDRERWPDWSDPAHGNRLRGFFGGDTGLKPNTNRQLVRATVLIGKGVNDRRGHDAGTLRDLVVGLPDGRVRYVVLDFDRAWRPLDRPLALPMGALDYPPGLRVDLVLAVPRERLEASEAFDREDWPDALDESRRGRLGRWLDRARR